jgi:Fe-S cluster biogenesis protein NfuA
LLCMECYLKFHGCCGSCSTSFLPAELKPNVNNQMKAKFIGAENKNYILCDECYNLIRNEFPEFFAK